MKYDAEAAELRRWAIEGARAEIVRLLTVFPELRKDVGAGGAITFPALRRPTSGATMRALADATTAEGLKAVKHARAVERLTLKHWRKTAAPKAPSSNGAGHQSVRAAVRAALTDTPQNGPELRAALDAAGYVHTGTTNLNSRIAQEAVGLVEAGEARRTKRGWRLKGGK